MHGSLSRRLIGGAIIVLASVGSVFGLRRALNKPVKENAPAFRQKGEGTKITVVEFSDFQCPACRMAEEPIKNFMQAYQKDAHFIFKDFPLRMHPWAPTAASIAECAGKQGKFWPVHDAFYAHQEEWSQSKTPEEDLLKLASAQGLDEAALKTCLADPSIKEAIESDVQEAKNRWVYSTPTFFVNGKRFIGGIELATKAPIWIDRHVK